MIKGRLIFFSIILFVSILIVTYITTVFATEKPITLTLAVYDNSIGLAGQHYTILQEEIEKKTNGRVNVKIYWSSSLLKGKEMLRGVADGTVDMAVINPNYYPNQLPMNGAYAIIPMGPDKYKYKSWVFNTGIERISEIRAEFTKNNQVPIYTFVLLPKIATSTKPIASLEDFKGKKIRAASRWLLEMLGGSGAVPVSVPWSDCYMALQTGTIDAVLTNLDGIHNSKLDEIGKNIYLCPQIWNSSAFTITMNTDTWNKLPNDIQEQIIEAKNWTSIRYGEAFEKEWNRIVAEQKEMGCVINKMTPEEAEIWGNLPAIEDVEAKWIKETEKRGVENAAVILRQIKEIVAEGVKRERANK